MREPRLTAAKALLGHDLGYLRDQLSRILLDLHRVALVTRSESLDSRATRQELEAALSGAVHDTLRLLVASAGSSASPQDIEQYEHEIIANGREGYESVAYSLGLIEETTRQRQRRELAGLLLRVEDALRGSRAESRTLIHIMLAPYENDRRELLARLVDLTDQVTMGNIEWENYQIEARLLTHRIRQTHLRELY